MPVPNPATIELFEKVYDPFGRAYIDELMGAEFAADTTAILREIEQVPTRPQYAALQGEYREQLANRFIDECIGGAALRASHILDDPEILQVMYDQRAHVLLGPKEQLPENPTLEDMRQKGGAKLVRNAELGNIETFLLADGMADPLVAISRDSAIRKVFVKSLGDLAHTFGMKSDDGETARLYGLTKLGPKSDNTYFHQYIAGDIMSRRLSIPCRKFELVFSSDLAITHPVAVTLPEAFQAGDEEDRRNSLWCPLSRQHLPPALGGQRLMRVHTWVVAHFFMALTSKDGGTPLWHNYPYQMGIPPFPLRRRQEVIDKHLKA